MKQKIISLILIIVILQQMCSFVFAQNIITNEEVTNTTNTEDTNNNVNENNTTLDEQQDKVENQIKETNTKLEYVQSELSSTMLRVQELEDKVLEYQSQMDELSEQLENLQNSINETSKNLSTVEQSFNEKDELLRKRLVAMYEAGDTSYLDVLLASRNLVEFISGYYLITELAEYDNSLIEDVEEQKNSIETTKKKLEREETQVKLVKAKKEQTTLILENTKTMHEGYVSKLSKDEKKLKEEITKYKLEQARIEALIRNATNGNQDINIQYTGGVMIWPIAKSGTVITSNYGMREHPIQGVVKIHTGLDIGAGFGSPVVAAADGVVSYAGWLGGYGNCVMINHGNGLTTLYGHGQKILTELNKEVKQGDLIMEVGSTGNSTGPHLHFEVRLNGNHTNPLNYVKVP